MNNAILIQQVYPGYGFGEMMQLTEAHHKAYCEKWDIDYKCLYENPLPDSDPVKGSWGKVELIRGALQKGYDFVIWLDADTLIVDFDSDLRNGVEPFKIGACWHRIPQLNHWNVGALYIDNCHATQDFINDWLSKYPGTAQWLEQGTFNEMAMQSKTVVTISDKWNATLDVSEVPDAVVLGFHGQGNAEQRTKIMRDTMQQLFPAQEAQTTQGKSEVNHDG